jgi:hypothetical protein
VRGDARGRNRSPRSVGRSLVLTIALLLASAGTGSATVRVPPPACPPITIGCKFTASYHGTYRWQYFETRPDKSTLADSVSLSWREVWSRAEASWVLTALSGADGYRDSADAVSACDGVLSWFTHLPSTIVGGPLTGSPDLPAGVNQPARLGP